MSNVWMTNALLAAGKVNQDDIGISLNPVKAVKKIGRAIGGTVRGAHKSIGKTLASVPVVGPGLNAAYKINIFVTPVTIAANIAAGKRIDRAVYEGFKERVKAYQDIAPYVQTVVSMVPGIGPGVSGAIGAANALSKGRPITEAMIEAARGAIPGGPAAQAAFDVSVAAVQGKAVPEVMLNAIPIDSQQKKLLVAGVMSAKDIADGKKVDETLYNRGVEVLPPDVQKATQIGLAIAQGQKLQRIAESAVPQAIPTFFEAGKLTIEKNEVLKAGTNLLKGDVQKGFIAGTGFMKHKVTPSAILAMRRSLNGDAKKGFDIAVSTRIGAIGKPISKEYSAKERFGYYVTQGMQGNKPGRKTAMMRTLVKDPEVRKGAKEAVNDIRGNTGFWAFWRRLINKITS